ncbi:MAG: LysM peptidoglycan-binding domain-containing protein [Planctomycetes bacterium]|nr:LysM peptidoglycan-binding domain-containing protein [Planctomycetota bacterium]
MTSDAKIGLLLGLVFIFVIAFVINGLPSLRPPTMGKADVSTITGEDFVAGVEGKAATAANWDSSLDQPRTGNEPAPVAAESPKPAVSEMPQSSGPLASGPQASPSPTASGEGVRFSLPLPAAIGKILDQLPVVVPPSRADTYSMDTPKPAPEQPTPSEHPPVATASQPRVEPPAEPTPAEAPAKAADVVESARPAPVASKPATIPGGKTYMVVAGDTLPAIAKKFYGPEEGNRLANIDRIYQANLTLLPSPAEVKAGQKLIIPPPLPPLAKPTTTLTTAAKTTTTPAPNPNKPSDMLPQALFEKVEALGKRAPAAVPPPTPQDRWYTVQDGDSLWKIAAAQLGAGSRWDEIHKLNAEILTSQDALKVGMKLRLPAK